MRAFGARTVVPPLAACYYCGMSSRGIRILPAADLPRRSFIEALNAAYADYHVPINMTRRSFEALVARESIRLEFSAAAVFGRRVVGTGMLGVRGRRGWIGGMGVLPRLRRRGIGRRMMHYLIDQANQLGLERLQLEVITENEGAYALYEPLGFKRRRKLLIIERPPGYVHGTPTATSPGLHIEAQPPEQLFERLPCLPTVPRSWQCEVESLRPAIDQIDGLAAIDEANGQVAGVCLYSGDAYRIGLAELVATCPEVGDALLAYVIGLYPLARMSCINLPEDDPMLPVYMAAGFGETLAQYEMHLSLVQESST